MADHDKNAHAVTDRQQVDRQPMNRRRFVVSLGAIAAAFGGSLLATSDAPAFSPASDDQSATDVGSGDNLAGTPRGIQARCYVFASDPRAGQAGYTVMPG
jgi:hypothetical protein